MEPARGLGSLRHFDPWPSDAGGLRGLLESVRYRDDSPFRPHLGVLLWVIGVVEARSFAQIGMGDLLPCFAACQALEALGLHCRGMGIAPPGTAIAPQVRGHAEAFHPFLEFLADDPLVVAARQAPASIDLLLLSPEARDVPGLIEAWIPALSPRGVVVVHGTGSDLSAGAMIARRPVLRHSEGLGLAVILVGDEAEGRLAAAATRPGEPARDAVEQDFLGELAALSRTAWAEEPGEVAPGTTEAKLAAQETEIRRLTEGLEQRFRELALLERHLADHALSRVSGLFLSSSTLPRRPAMSGWVAEMRRRSGRAARSLLDQSPPAVAEPLRRAARRARRLLRL